MEITVLAFIVALPIAFLAWTLKFRTWLSLLAIAPLCLLLLPVLALNSETTPTLVHTWNTCFDVRDNATVNAAGNVTTYGNSILCSPKTTSWVVGFENMQILNVAMGTFMLVVMAIVIKRTIEYIDQNKASQDD